MHLYLKVLFSFCFSLLFLATAVSDVVKLSSGSEIHGTVLKQTDATLWIDIGSEVISVNLSQVSSVDLSEGSNQAVVASVESSNLFRTIVQLPERSPREQAKRVGASVIKVSTPGGLGSGVLLNEDGFAVTNAHVIQGETDLRATVWIPQEDGTLKRTTIDDITIIAINNHLDLALLHLSHPDDKPFDYSVLENTESIEVGQIVFAIGNPLGLERSMSQGVISTKQRSFDGLTYIQTDAAINPGNSGGPLFNSSGEVVGITNMGIASAESLNFAIPTRYVKDFISNREAFAYDSKNPNAGHLYHNPPERTENGVSSELRDGHPDS